MIPMVGSTWSESNKSVWTKSESNWSVGTKSDVDEERCGRTASLCFSSLLIIILTVFKKKQRLALRPHSYKMTSQTIINNLIHPTVRGQELGQVIKISGMKTDLDKLKN